MSVPALVIAGTHSGVGKTTVTVALISALGRRGLRVQPFKIGPDFIDPSLHTRAAGRTSRNLDGWMLGPQTNATILARASQGADIAIIEGVMGLFDGREAVIEAGSTAEMAKLLGMPVVLIVDGAAMARSAAALVQGFERFDAELEVAGVIFNRVAGAGHFAYLRDSVAEACRAKVLGWLAREDGVSLPERNLGLLMADEVLNEARLEALANWIEATLDLEALLRIARRDGQVSKADGGKVKFRRRSLEGRQAAQGVRVHARPLRIGVARDQAFCFYYQDNLDLLADGGAELIEFSPTADRHLPRGLAGLYLGGGYPELHAEALAANETMRAGMARLVSRGIPVYAECGGLMYLTEAMVDVDGQEHPMVGVFPVRVRMQKRLAAISYSEVEGVDGTGWLRPGERARGHEFHYSTVEEMPLHIARRYRVRTLAGERAEGYGLRNVLASYIHLHFASCPRLAERFVAACADFRNSSVGLSCES